MRLDFAFNHAQYSDDDLNTSIQEILEENILCAMATVTEENSSYINTAYYCYNDRLEFFILTDPDSKHSQNLRANNSVALAICDSRQPWTEDQKGLQIVGRCQPATGAKLVEATTRYLRRFVGLKEWITHPGDFAKGALNTRPYVIQTAWLKLYDTKRFGDDNFIPLSY